MRGKWRAQRADGGAHAARGFVGGAAQRGRNGSLNRGCFNAARGFVGGAAARRGGSVSRCFVSMPHAALWVVQRDPRGRYGGGLSFNAARGFVGGAATHENVRS